MNEYKKSIAHEYIKKTLRQLLQLCQYHGYRVEMFAETDPLSLFSCPKGPKKYVIALKLIKNTQNEEPKWCYIKEKNAEKFCVRFQKWVVRTFEPE